MLSREPVLAEVTWYTCQLSRLTSARGLPKNPYSIGPASVLGVLPPVLTRNLLAIRMLKLAAQSFRPSCCEETLTVMRSLREFSFLLLFCLTLGLVCSEFPETLNLCDDTSNDFVASPCGPRLGAVTIVHQVLASRPGNSVADFAIRTLAMTPSAEPVVPSGPELLQLLSIQRK